MGCGNSIECFASEYELLNSFKCFQLSDFTIGVIPFKTKIILLVDTRWLTDNAQSKTLITTVAMRAITDLNLFRSVYIRSWLNFVMLEIQDSGKRDNKIVAEALVPGVDRLSAVMAEAIKNR